VTPDLVGSVRARLALDGGEVSGARVAAAVRGVAGLAGDVVVLDAVESVRAGLAGAGPLEPLLRLPGVTDVLVNGVHGVWVDRGDGLQRADVTFAGDGDVRRLAVRLVAACGRRLDDAQPWADARLPDGTRVHAVLPPLSPDGPCLSLRIPARRPFTLDELEAAGCVTGRGAGLLARLVRSRLAFLVTGGTGSGKTTLLASVLSLVDPAERIVLVEDSAELRPAHPHVVRLEARSPNVEGVGGIGLDVLVRQALRMRPDRLVVGEVRGAEVVELLAALNTGHQGGCGTVHANRAADLPARLEALGAAAGLSIEALHSQLAAAVHVVVHVERVDGMRRVVEVCLLRRGPGGRVQVEPAHDFRRPDSTGPAADDLERLLDTRR
jgi:pilus assembly protein CpaF